MFSRGIFLNPIIQYYNRIHTKQISRWTFNQRKLQNRVYVNCVCVWCVCFSIKISKGITFSRWIIRNFSGKNPTWILISDTCTFFAHRNQINNFARLWVWVWLGVQKEIGNFILLKSEILFSMKFSIAQRRGWEANRIIAVF